MESVWVAIVFRLDRAHIDENGIESVEFGEDCRMPQPTTVNARKQCPTYEHCERVMNKQLPVECVGAFRIQVFYLQEDEHA